MTKYQGQEITYNDYSQHHAVRVMHMGEYSYVSIKTMVEFENSDRRRIKREIRKELERRKNLRRNGFQASHT